MADVKADRSRAYDIDRMCRLYIFYGMYRLVSLSCQLFYRAERRAMRWLCMLCAEGVCMCQCVSLSILMVV